MPACPLCRRAEAVRVWAAAKRAVGGACARYDISAVGHGAPEIHYCASCAFAWNADREAVGRMERAYAGYGDQPEYRCEQDRRIATARRLLSALPAARGKRLLDVGSSVGYYVKAAQSLGYRALGVEPSRWAAEWGARNLGVPILNADFLRCQLERESFDVVLMADVLEHAGRFDEMLSRAEACLKPGGSLLIVTPDIGSRVARALGPRWWSLKPEHVVYFSRGSLAAALGHAGLQVAVMTTAARRFSLGYWLFLLTRARWFLTMPLLARLSVSLDFGDQLLCVATKAGASSASTGTARTS